MNTSKDAPMKCLSIRQPWAWLVCVGAKTIENRSWQTAHRGRIAIHAGGFTKALETVLQQDATGSINRQFFAFGAIIGVADLFDCVSVSAVQDEEWAEGPYCLKLRNPRLFSEPIPHKGRVNLCRLPEDVSQLVERHVEDSLNVEESDEIRKCVKAIPPGPIEEKYLRPVFRPTQM